MTAADAQPALQQALHQTLQQRLAALSPDQRERLLQQLAARGQVLPPAVAAGADAVSPDAHELEGHDASAGEAETHEPLPLTPAQQQLWVLHRLQPDSSAYHIAFAWRLAQPLDAARLDAALQALVQRHGALRCGFETAADGSPRQRLWPQVASPLQQAVFDGDHASDDALGAHLERYAQAPFALQRPPLLRVQLLQLPDGRQLLAWVLHHLVADGWSRGLLMRELSALYAGQPLPPLRHGHTASQRAQLHWLASAEADAQAAWWRQRLAGLQPLALPLDRPHQADSDWRSGTVQQRLAGVGPRVAAAAAACGATPFMLLMTVFQLLLWRWTGRRDLAIGVPVAGRQAAGDAALIGFFVNTLVLRTQGPAAGRVSDWVDAVKRSAADAFDHAQLPLARVIEAVGAAREPGRAPLVELMFQHQGGSYGAQNTDRPEVLGQAVQQWLLPPAHTKFDLTWHVLERGADLQLAVEYRSALFDPARIQRLLDHFQRLLHAVLADPRRPLATLPLHSAAERAQLQRWQTAPPRAPAPWRSVLQGFAAQMARTPDAPAVATPDGVALSYRSLDQASNALARALRARGVGPETIVGLCLPRVPLLMVAFWAVWKAGAAWLALDPVLPASRLRYMARDAGVRGVLVLDADAARLQDAAVSEAGDDDGAALPLWPLRADAHDGLDALGPAPAAESADTSAADAGAAPPLHPQQLAYVLYTSGSTGRPKGTLLPHAGLSHYLQWCVDAYPLTQGRGAPVNSSIGFDATLTGLFAPLWVGGCVTLLPDSGSADTLDALATAMDAGHSIVKLTPAHMNALLPLLQARPPDPARLPRAFVIGGEALSEAHVEGWRRLAPQLALINEYGPTETVVGCCVHTVGADDRGALPIGRPITGARLYVLDETLQPVPAGAVGELYIGGAGMARGYLGRPALTAERFLPDPHADAADGADTADTTAARKVGATMYRTGDLARWGDDGVLHFLGRADQQLKLRGHRIEAGEVETALVQHAGVAEAVVDLRRIGTADVLLAWVRVADGQALPADWRARLAHWLPAYMLPSQLRVLPTLPLTANGKVDRAALPLPAAAALEAPGDTTAIGADADPRLQQLHAIWCAVLQRPQISPEANFFDLGGDSVAAMQIVARAHQAGWRLSPAAVFQHQTLAAQAAALEAAHDAGVQAEAPPADGEAAVLAPAQWGFFERVRAGELPQPAHWNQSLLLDVDPALDPDHLAQALQALVQRHASLRLHFAPAAEGNTDSPPAWAAVHGNAVWPLQQRSLAAVADADLPTALDEVLREAQAGLDLAAGRLLAAWWLPLGGEQGRRGTRLLLVAHHLLVDGLSWRLLLADLAVALANPHSERTVDAAPAQARWSARLQAQAGALQRELPYWQAMLQPLPAWPQTAAAATEASARDSRPDPLPAELLTAAAAALGARADELLLTALAQTLQQWQRTPALLLDLESHGRGLDGVGIDDTTLDAAQAAEAAALARCVGWLTACWPLRLALPVGAPQRQLQAVREALAAVPQRGLGFGVLRQQGLLPRSPAPVSFNHLGVVDSPGLGPLRGLAPEPLPAQRAPDAARAYLLEVVSWQQQGQLHLLWRHDARLGAGTVDALARRMRAQLQSLLALAAIAPPVSSAPSTPSAA